MANPSATTALKLRDSCDACAASKVKCHKQKPTCSRCQRRGTACHYLVTKRAGRRVDSATFSPGGASRTQWEHFDLDSWLSTSSTMSSTHSTDDDIFLQQLLTPTASSAGTKSIQPSAPTFISIEPNDDIFMGQSISAVTTPCTPSNSLGPGSSGVSPVNLAMDLDDYFPSSVSLWAPKVHETSALDALPPLDLGSESQSSSSDVNNTLHDTCIARATRIMQQQFHQANSELSNNSCTLSEQDGTNSSSGPTLDLVIESNKEYINQVDAMLQCQCLHDGYLLTMLSLVVFKVLDSYQAAASAPEIQKANLNAMEDDAQRRAAQRVMGELHRVQRLVNQLSINIKRHTVIGHQERTTGALMPDGQKEESETSLPFSRVMLGQLETDMRKRLRSLSLGMGIHLRRD